MVGIPVCPQFEVGQVPPAWVHIVDDHYLVPRVSRVIVVPLLVEGVLDEGIRVGSAQYTN